MLDRLKEIPSKLLEIWKGWTKKQKTMIVSAAVVFIVAVGILAFVLSRPNFTELTVCDDYKQMNSVTTLLTSNNYEYEIENLTVKVKKSDLTNCKMLIASEDIQPSGYTFEDAMKSDLTTTESDKQKKYAHFLESKFTDDICSMSGIKNATVTVHLADDTNSFYANKKDTSVAVTLDTTKTIGEDTAESIAVFLATAVGNEDTKCITIIDTDGNTLFNGASANGSTSGVGYASKLKYKAQIESTVAAGVKNTVLATALFNDATIAINLDLDWDTVNKIATEYEAQEGREEGLYDESYELTSTGNSGASGTPGTVSNGETTYELTDGTSSSSVYTVKQYHYLPNELVTTTISDPGKIVYDTSTMSVTLVKNVVYNEEDCEKLGYLDDMTWEEYKAANSEPIETEVDERYTSIVSTGTGIDEDDISILAYSRYIFYDREATKTSPFLVIEIILAVLIAGLLVFIIIRSTRPVAVEETEPELSVEDMLATTKEKQQPIEEIDLQDKSETRLAIEKFVDENPEAVALLLRNWLNEGWS